MIQNLCRRKHVGVESDFIDGPVEGEKTGVVPSADLAIEIVIGKIARPAAGSDLSNAIDVEDESRAIEGGREMIPGEGLNKTWSLSEGAVLDVEDPGAVRARRLVKVPAGRVAICAALVFAEHCQGNGIICGLREGLNPAFRLFHSAGNVRQIRER